MKKYFICITTWENYSIGEKNAVWGVEPHRKDDLLKSSKGDSFIFYLKEVSPGVGGLSGSIFERESDVVFEENKTLWKDGLYPFRTKIKLLDDSTRYKRFHAGYLCDLGIVKGRTNLGPWLNTSMQEISEREFNDLKNLIQK